MIRKYDGNKVRMCLFVFLFVFTVGITNFFKTSINEVDRLSLDNTIKGVGKVKSEKIIAEREAHGYFKSEEDFRNRTKQFLGKSVHSRIARTYKMK